MPISEEQFKKLEERITKLESEKLDAVLKGQIEHVLFNKLKVSQLTAGLRVFTAVRSATVDIPMQGEVYATNIAGTRKICVFINGVQYCSTLT